MLGITIMKLTDEQVKQMREEFRLGAGVAQLGTKYGVSRQTAYNVLAGRNRKYMGLGDGFAAQSELEGQLMGHPGDALRGLRKLLGVTQVELAIKIGRSPSTVGNWETGTTAMTVVDRRRLVGWVRELGLEDDLGADFRGYKRGLAVGKGGDFVEAPNV